LRPSCRYDSSNLHKLPSGASSIAVDAVFATFVIDSNCFYIRLPMQRFLLLFAFFIGLAALSAQVVVGVRVNSGSATSDCGDPFSGPDPLFAAAVEGQPFTWYPDVGGCFTPLPDTAFVQNYPCLSQVPVAIEVCLRVTENDGFVLPPLLCDLQESCSEQICDNFIVPPLGSTADYTLQLDVLGSTSGEINFTVATEGFAFPDNDFICNAVDLGVLNYGDTLGDMTLGQYSNLCATDLNEPSPLDLGAYFTNQAGVWFKFRTSANPSGLFVVEALSDPQNTGDTINLEMEVFTTDDGSCTGNLAALSDFQLTNNDNDHTLRIPCAQPDTDYYIWVDGVNVDGERRGIFGLQVWDLGVPEAGDLRCDFYDFGVIAEGGSATLPEPVANFCGTDVQDPFLPTFVSQHSVWFSFVAPPSGHVLVEGVSDTVRAPIGIQLAVYRAFNSSCTGFFSFVDAQFTTEDLDETMELTCLYPGDRYFILVDGSGSAARGAFTLTVSDAGDITPVNDQEVTLCFGESLSVGSSTYSATGVYADTISVFRGCDSIVNTTLTVLEELVLTVEQTQPAIGEDGTNGQAIATATGGAGGYTFAWCSGAATASVDDLIADTECCVTVMDTNNCTDEVCFIVEFTTAIIPTFTNDSLACYGDTNGELTFSVVNGVPPYSYSWQNVTNSLNGSGTIDTEGGSVMLTNLPAGDYQIMVNDAFFDTTFTAVVWEPEELFIELDAITNASCYQFTDGMIATTINGGTLPYTFNWSDGQSTEDASGLGAGNYLLEVTDANACRATLETNITEPPEFIATASVDQEVSCFAGEDGQLSVNTNGNAVGWNWSSGATEAVVSGLPTGDYSVTVTNSDGCLDTTLVNLPQPTEPLRTTILEVQPISCFGDADGILGAEVAGPFNSLTYQWSTGATVAEADGLTAGTYDILVRNEKGCVATAQYQLDQPTEIIGEVFTTDINCVDGPNAGAISVESVAGGTPPYQYQLDDGPRSTAPLFEGLIAADYEVQILDAAGCSLPLRALILPPPPISVLIDGESELHLGDSLRLKAVSTSTDVTYDWSFGPAFQAQTLALQPTTSGIYTVSVLDTLTFCQASASFQVFVDQSTRLFAPNIFSPNNDATNDTFFLHAGREVSSILSLRIFARNGQLVYEETNLFPNSPDRAWDGFFRGQPLNPGVFVYVAEIELLDGRREIVRGDVTLIR
jgi:gliding motility-associated-like protein